MAEDVDIQEGGVTDMSGLITFVPAVELEWDLGFEIEVIFEAEE